MRSAAGGHIEDWVISYVERRRKLLKRLARMERAHQVYEDWVERQERWLARSAPRAVDTQRADSETRQAVLAKAQALFTGPARRE